MRWGGRTRNQKKTEKWKLGCLRGAESDPEEQRVTRTIGWDTNTLVQFQARPQTLQQAVWFTGSLNKLVVKGDKNLPPQGRTSYDYEAQSVCMTTMLQGMPGTYSIWLQIISEGQDAVSAPKSVSSPEVLSPQYDIIAKQQYALQFQCKVWGHYVVLLNTYSRFAKVQVLYFCCRTTLNHGSLSGSWTNVSPLWYTLPCRSKATHWTIHLKEFKVEYILYYLSKGEEFITAFPKALVNKLHIVNARFPLLLAVIKQKLFSM